MSGCPFNANVTNPTKSSKALTQDGNLWAIMNTVLDGLIIIDNEGTIQAFNPSAVRIFGYLPDEVIGENVKMLMPEPYCSEHDSYLTNYLNTKNAKVIGIGREVFGKRKDGSSFSMELGVNEMIINNELFFVGTVRDISDRKNAENQVRSYILALKRSNQELDDFAYIASHDLKEPLRGLSNNAQFLLEDYKSLIDGAGTKRIERMISLCERMEQLINDLLYFSRIGNQELAIKDVDFNTVIADITIMMGSVLEEQNVNIIITKELPIITCDAVRITEVFRNLITNAIKYNVKENKNIEIGYNFLKKEMEYDTYVFYVKDNGIGIPKEHYDDIFRIFKRLNDEDESVKGTGVGLTFVKKIIERHGGNIWLESEIGHGTTFYFTIEYRKYHEHTSINNGH